MKTILNQQSSQQAYLSRLEQIGRIEIPSTEICPSRVKSLIEEHGKKLGQYYRLQMIEERKPDPYAYDTILDKDSSLPQEYETQARRRYFFNEYLSEPPLFHHPHQQAADPQTEATQKEEQHIIDQKYQAEVELQLKLGRFQFEFKEQDRIFESRNVPVKVNTELVRRLSSGLIAGLTLNIDQVLDLLIEDLLEQLAYYMNDWQQKQLQHNKHPPTTRTAPKSAKLQQLLDLIGDLM